MILLCVNILEYRSNKRYLSPMYLIINMESASHIFEKKNKRTRLRLLVSDVHYPDGKLTKSRLPILDHSMYKALGMETLGEMLAMLKLVKVLSVSPPLLAIYTKTTFPKTLGNANTKIPKVPNIFGRIHKNN